MEEGLFGGTPPPKQRKRGYRDGGFYNNFPKLNTKPFRDLFRQWFDYRSEKGLSVDNETMTRFLEKLNKWGQARAMLSIRNAISNGWTDLFEPQVGESLYKKLYGKNHDQ